MLEGEVLAKLRNELLPDPHQYGGTPKCGTEHMLIDMWERVMSALEGGTNAAVPLGVDYEKAFNRMDHGVCLRKLRELGASEGSLALVKDFLEDRCMTITIDGHSATPVEIKKGSPQGSVLGCLLYCVSTQCLATGLRNNAEGNIRYFPQGGGDEAEIRFWENGDDLPAAFLYVDDTTLLDVVPTESAIRHYTTATPVEDYVGMRLETDLDTLNGRAEEIGMRINKKKTQLLIISPRNGCHSKAEISCDGHRALSLHPLRQDAYRRVHNKQARVQTLRFQDQPVFDSCHQHGQVNLHQRRFRPCL